MIPFDEIKKYLPQYLSVPSQENLFEELKSFPDNIDQRFYSDLLARHTIIYQGDGLAGILVVNLPDEKVNAAPVMVIIWPAIVLVVGITPPPVTTAEEPVP